MISHFKEHPVHPDYSILSNTYLPSIVGILKFETISTFGRLFRSSKPKINTKGKNYLHLGCGSNYIENWINADFFKVRFWSSKNKVDWELDFRYKLKCDSEVWDGVFTEHTLEHLTHLDNLNLFKELWRTMKDGAIIRICVPGLQQAILPYTSDSPNLDFEKHRQLYPDLASSIWGLTQNWAHFSVWDFNLIKLFLENAGFTNVTEREYLVGGDNELIKDTEGRKVGSLYVEATKYKT